MRISDWSSDVCSSDLDAEMTIYGGVEVPWGTLRSAVNMSLKQIQGISEDKFIGPYMIPRRRLKDANAMYEDLWGYLWNDVLKNRGSEEHTYELQSLMRISYAAFCLKKKIKCTHIVTT